MSASLDISKLTAAERADYEERAAIAQHDGGLSQSAAERLALSCVLQARTLPLQRVSR